MSRSARLFDLLQALRRRRRPVSAEILAQELGVSVRTVYRDIATLTAQGAAIAGEAGVGYLLRPGFLLPPLMLSADEIEALGLGASWVAARADQKLAAAAADALAKIAAVLPDDLRDRVDDAGLILGPGPDAPPERIELTTLRAAIRQERKLAIAYEDAGGRASRRVVWPVALAFFERVRVLVAWCELRDGFRHFRADRMARVEILSMRYPKRRAQLLKAWRRAEGIAEPS